MCAALKVIVLNSSDNLSTFWDQKMLHQDKKWSRKHIYSIESQSL